MFDDPTTKVYENESMHYSTQSHKLTCDRLVDISLLFSCAHGGGVSGNGWCEESLSSRELVHCDTL